MATTKGLPLPADIQIILDKEGSWFKNFYGALGLGAPGETSTTSAEKAIAARDGILGDGGSNAGIANVELQQTLAPILNRQVLAARYDSFAQTIRDLFTALDNQVQVSLPSGITFQSATNRALDLWLARLNATNTNCPAAPAGAPSLAAATGGSIPACAVGSAPRVKCTYSATATPWYESLPNTASAQVALAGINNAYTFTLAGNAPISGYLNVYRQLVGAAVGDAYGLDQRVVITSGVAHPLVTVSQPDQLLRFDYQPPSYAQLMILPEAAAIYALAYATPPSNAGIAGALLTFSAQCFLSPSNVCLNPVYILAATPTTNFLGIGNPISTGILGQWVATGFTTGAIAAANVAALAQQGFAGASNGVQARVTSALNGNGVITNVGYTYLDSTHSTPQSATAAAPGTIGTAVDSLLDIGIPGGRIVLSVTGVTTGTSTTGTITFEAKTVRAI